MSSEYLYLFINSLKLHSSSWRSFYCSRRNLRPTRELLKTLSFLIFSFFEAIFTRLNLDSESKTGFTGQIESELRNPGSGSVPKCHGSAKLVLIFKNYCCRKDRLNVFRRIWQAPGEALERSLRPAFGLKNAFLFKQFLTKVRILNIQ